MADRKASAADAETIAACRERGETRVTARQLERWRQAGCLPERERWYEAGTRGSHTANPDGYVDHVVAIAGLMRAGVTLREAPVALFADGFPVDLEVLKEAYCYFLSRFKEGLAVLATKKAPGARDVLEQADAAAQVTAAHVAGTVLGPWKHRARELANRLQPGEPTSAQRLLEGALSAMMTALLAGEVPSGAGVEEALTVAGLNDGQDFELSAKRMAASNVDSMMEAVRSASEQDFQMAREGLEGAFRYAKARVRLEKALYSGEVSMPGLELVRPENPLARGILIPPFLLHGPEDREIAGNRIRQYEAADRLLAHLPPAFQRFMLPSNQAELPNESQELRDELQSYLDAFAGTYPEDAEILRQASDIDDV